MNPIIIHSMKQFERARENLLKHLTERKWMFLDVRVAANRPFGYYWAEGTNAYHLVKFEKLPDGKGRTECGCISSVLCYHQAAAVDVHIKRVAEMNKKQEDEMDAAIECRACDKFVWYSQTIDRLCPKCYDRLYKKGA